MRVTNVPTEQGFSKSVMPQPPSHLCRSVKSAVLRVHISACPCWAERRQVQYKIFLYSHEEIREMFRWLLLHFPKKTLLNRSWDSVIGIAIGYGLDDCGVEVQVPVGSRIFSSPCRPDRLWGLPNLLSNGYRGLFPLG
jgi:hypothetical protein